MSNDPADWDICTAQEKYDDARAHRGKASDDGIICPTFAVEIEVDTEPAKAAIRKAQKEAANWCWPTPATDESAGR